MNVAASYHWDHRALITLAVKGLESETQTTIVMPVSQETRPGDPDDTHCRWTIAEPGSEPTQKEVGLGVPLLVSRPEISTDPHLGTRSVIFVKSMGILRGSTQCL